MAAATVTSIAPAQLISFVDLPLSFLWGNPGLQPALVLVAPTLMYPRLPCVQTLNMPLSELKERPNNGSLRDELVPQALSLIFLFGWNFLDLTFQEVNWVKAPSNVNLEGNKQANTLANEGSLKSPSIHPSTHRKRGRWVGTAHQTGRANT